MNTPGALTVFTSGVLMLYTHTAVMTKRLKAAEPTMVLGPSSPGGSSRLCTVSRRARRISGAEDPKAIKVRLATVGFQNWTLTLFPFAKVTSFSLLVMTSIVAMKTSDITAIPRKA